MADEDDRGPGGTAAASPRPQQQQGAHAVPKPVATVMTGLNSSVPTVVPPALGSNGPPPPVLPTQVDVAASLFAASALPPPADMVQAAGAGTGTSSSIASTAFSRAGSNNLTMIGGGGGGVSRISLLRGAMVTKLSSAQPVQASALLMANAGTGASAGAGPSAVGAGAGARDVGPAVAGWPTSYSYVPQLVQSSGAAMTLDPSTQPALAPISTEPADPPTSTQPVDPPTSTQPALSPTSTQPADPPTCTQPAELPTCSQPAELPTCTHPAELPTCSQPADPPASTAEAIERSCAGSVEPAHPTAAAAEPGPDPGPPSLPLPAMVVDEPVEREDSGAAWQAVASSPPTSDLQPGMSLADDALQGQATAAISSSSPTSACSAGGAATAATATATARPDPSYRLQLYLDNSIRYAQSLSWQALQGMIYWDAPDPASLMRKVLGVQPGGQGAGLLPATATADAGPPASDPPLNPAQYLHHSGSCSKLADAAAAVPAKPYAYIRQRLSMWPTSCFCPLPPPHPAPPLPSAEDEVLAPGLPLLPHNVHPQAEPPSVPTPPAIPTPPAPPATRLAQSSRAALEWGSSSHSQAAVVGTGGPKAPYHAPLHLGPTHSRPGSRSNSRSRLGDARPACSSDPAAPPAPAPAPAARQPRPPLVKAAVATASPGHSNTSSGSSKGGSSTSGSSSTSSGSNSSSGGGGQSATSGSSTSSASGRPAVAGVAAVAAANPGSRRPRLLAVADPHLPRSTAASGV